MRVQLLPRLTLREVQGLGETLDGYNEYFRQAIDDKECELWDINNGESFCITRLEYDSDKQYTVLVVCCYKGKNLKPFVDHITAIADKKNWYIRYHTKRASLVRWMHRTFDFDSPEYVCLRSPNNGK